MNSVPTTHRAEKQVLTDLLTRVEHETDIPGVTQTQIDDAREGWATQSQAKPSWTTLSSVPRRRCLGPSLGYPLDVSARLMGAARRSCKRSRASLLSDGVGSLIRGVAMCGSIDFRSSRTPATSAARV
jgi:hypothetical protein